MSRITNQNEPSPSPITPKLIKPPCRSSYEDVIDENSSPTSTTTKKSKKQLVAATDTSISNARSPSHVATQDGSVTKIYININFTGILETPSSTSIPEPESLDEPIRDMIRLLKKDLDERRDSRHHSRRRRSSSRSRFRSTTPERSSSLDGAKHQPPSLETVDDHYQNLALLKKGIRQRLPEGPSRIAAKHVASIPDEQLTPKKFLIGKKRRDYVVLGDLNMDE